MTLNCTVAVTFIDICAHAHHKLSHRTVIHTSSFATIEETDETEGHGKARRAGRGDEGGKEGGGGVDRARPPAYFSRRDKSKVSRRDKSKSLPQGDSATTGLCLAR